MRGSVFMVICIMLAGAVSGCGKGTVEPETSPPVPVEVTVVREETVGYRPEYSGAVVPERQVKLGFLVPGRVELITVNQGDRVNPGELVAALEPDDYQRQVQLAEAQQQLAEKQLAKVLAGARSEDLEALRSLLEEAGAAYAQAERDYQRVEQLYREGAVTRQQLEMAETQLKVAGERVTAAEARFKGAEAGPTTEDVELAREQVEVAGLNAMVARAKLEDTRLFAPVPGVILQRLAEEGEVVAAGQPVLLFGVMDPVKIRVGVTSTDLSSISVGLPAEVGLDAYPGEIFTGRVVSVPVAAEPQARTFPVELHVENSDGRLKSGMVARVRFQLGETAGVVLLPLSAVRRMAGNEAVFVLQPDTGKVVKRQVSLGQIYGERVEVHGLQAGETVVTAGASYLNDGDAVRVIGGEAR